MTKTPNNNQIQSKDSQGLKDSRIIIARQEERRYIDMY